MGMPHYLYAAVVAAAILQGHAVDPEWDVMVSVVALQAVALVLVGLWLAQLAVVQARAAEQHCGSPSVAQGPHHMHGGWMGVMLGG